MKALDTLNLKDLRAIARDCGIKDWWNMKKTDLIEAINAQEEVKIIAPKASENVQIEECNNTIENEENVSETTQKRKNHKRLIEYNGETKTLTAWAKELGIRHQTLYNRIVMKGMDPIEAFEKQVKHRG